MVLEGLVANKLSGFLEEYLENVNRDDLKISAGSINLQGLTLKKTALDNFELPVTVAHGQLGLFQVTIPWTSLKSSPVKIVISDVYIVVKPRSQRVYDEAAEKEQKQQKKTKALESYEALKEQRRAVALEKKNQKKESGGWLSYFTGSNIIQTIINNLHVQIQNIHVRYEDASDTSNPMAIGISLDELSLSTTDGKWNKSFLQAEQIRDVMHKLAELKNLSVYYNNKTDLMFGSMKSTDEFIHRMKELQADPQQANPNYILRPINGDLRAAVQKNSSNLNFAKPRVKASLKFDDFSLQLDDLQYRGLLKVLDHVSNAQHYDQFRSMRPAVGFKTKRDRQKWWHYFTWSINKQVHQRYFTWNDVKRRRQEQQEYIALYKRRKEVPYLPKIDDKAKEELDSLERDLEYDDIVLYRELADQEIIVETKNYKDYKKKQEEALKKKKASQGWFSGWFSSSSTSAEEESEVEEPLIQLTEEVRNELYQTIGTNAQEQAIQNSAPQDWTHMKFGFKLQRGSFDLRDSKTAKEITSIVYNDIKVKVALRQDSSANVGLTLQSFDILDKYSEETKFPRILSRRHDNAQESPQNPLVRLSVQTNTFVSTGHDISVQLSLEQLNFIVNALYIQRVLGFFIIPKDIDVSSIKDTALDQFSSMQQLASTQLHVALEARKSIDAHISLKAPNVLIPATCNADKNTPMVLVDLGHLTLETFGDPIASKKRVESGEKLREGDFYDRYDMALKHVQVLISEYGNWEHEIGWLRPASDQNLLSDITLLVEAQQRITASDDTRAKLKIKAMLPAINVTVSPPRISKLVKILNNLVENGLLEDPTGSMAAHRQIIAAQLLVNSPLKNLDSMESSLLESYWVELREEGTILLKENASDKSIIASISMKNAKVMNTFDSDSTIDKLVAKISEDNADIQKEKLLAINLPQDDLKDHIFLFAFPSLDDRSQWFGALKEATLIFDTLPVHTELITEEGLFKEEREEEEEERAQSADTDPHSQSSPSSTTKHETSISATFQLDSFTLTINNAERDISKIVINQLHANFTQRTFDMAVNLRLGSFAISDQWSEKADKYVLYSDFGITDPQTSENLMTVSYVQTTAKESPLFEADAAKRLSINFNDLHANFEPDIITQFVLLGYEVQNIVGEIKTRSQAFQAAVIETTSSSSTDRSRPSDITTETFKVVASLGEISLTCVRYGQQFLSLSLQSTSIELLTSPQEMQLKGFLRDVILHDLSTETHYKDILSVAKKDADLVEFSYRQVKTAPMESVDASAAPYYDKFVEANISSMRFVFLQRFVKQLQAYFTEGILWETLRKGNSKPEDQVVQKVEQEKEEEKELETKATPSGKMSLSINILDPFIIAPVSWKSNDYLALNLGDIHVRNNLKSVDIEAQVNHLESYHITLKGLSLKSKLSGKVQRISNAIDMTMSAAMAISGDKVPSLDFNMNASDIDVKMAHMQYQLLFRLISGNLGDNGAISSTKTETSKEVAMESQSDNSESAFDVTLPMIRVTLLRGQGELFGKENRIASVGIDKLHALYKRRPDRSASCEVGIASINAEDLRAETLSSFKNIITSIPEATPFLTFSMVTAPAGGSTTLGVKMSKPRITFIPEVVQEITTFFTTRSTVDDNKSAATTSAVETKDTETSSSPEHFYFSQKHEYLGEDIRISPQRQFIIQESNENGEVIINGEGHTITFDLDSSNEPLIVIPDGTTLHFRNVKLRYIGDITDLYDKEQNVQLLTNKDEGVVHETLTTQTSEEEIAQNNESSKGDIIFDGHFDSPSLVLPEDFNDKNSRCLVVTTSLKAHYKRVSAIEEGKVLIESFLAFSENKSGIRSDPMFDAGGVSALFNTQDLNSDIVERTIELDIKEKDLQLRFSYQDTKMISNIVTKLKNFNTDVNKEEAQALCEEHLREHGTDYHYEEDESVVDKASEAAQIVFYESDHDTTTTSSSRGGDDDDNSEDSGVFLDAEEDKKHDNDSDSDNWQSAEVPIASQSSEEAVPEPEKPRQSTAFNISLKSERKISLLIVDDLKGWDIPLLDVNVKNLTLEDVFFDSKSGKFIAKMNFTLDSRYYNVALADFEFILEPYPIEVIATRLPTPRADAPDANILTASLQCMTTDPPPSLNINVSHSMMRTISKTSRLWKEDYKQSTKSVSQRFDPFIVQNHSGRTIHAFWKREEHQDQKWTLRDSEVQGLKQLSAEVKNARSDLVIQVDGFPSITINAKRVGTSSVLGLDMKIVCLVAVTESDGRKFITVRSGFYVQNDTTVPIDIGTIRRSDNSVTKICTVRPKTNRGVPVIQDVSNSYLCVRPHIDEADYQHQWSSNVETLTFQNIMKLDKSRSFECAPNRPSGDPFFVVAQVSTNAELPDVIKSKIEKENLWNKMQALNYCIRIIPPLSISNLLRLSMQFSVFSAKNHTEKPTLVCNAPTLESGDIQHIYIANPAEVLFMKTKLADDGQSKWNMPKDFSRISTDNTRSKPLSTVIQTQDDRKNVLNLHIDYEFNTNAFRHALVYVPYWIVNHSGQPLSVYDGDKIAAGNHYNASMNFSEQQKPALESHSAIEPLPFSASAGAKIKFTSGSYKSKQAIALVATTVPQAVDLIGPDTKVPMHLTLSSTPAPGKFKRTLITKISSRYVVINRLASAIEITQAVDNAKVISVSPDGRQNLDMFRKPEKFYELQLSQASIPWSSKFRIDRVGDIPLRTEGSFGVNVNIQEDNGVTFIVVERLFHPPYIVRNETPFAMQFSQTGQSKKTTIQPRASVDYWWDHASNVSTLTFHNVNQQAVDIKVSPNTITTEPDKNFTTMGDVSVVYSVESCGPTRILTLSTREGTTSSQESGKQHIEYAMMDISLHIPKIGISLVDEPDNDKFPEELLFLSFDGIDMNFKQTTENKYAQLTLSSLQFDNQLHDAHFPVLLAMTQVPTDSVPMINLSVAMQNLKDAKDDALLFPMIHLALQEFDVKLSSDLIVRLQKFFGAISTGSSDDDEQAADELLRVSTEPVQQTNRRRRIYFCEFKMHPLHLHLSFHTTEALGEQLRKNAIFAVLSQGVGAVINIDEADLRFNLLQLEDHFSTVQELQSRIIQHYMRGFLLQLFGVLLSFEAIGNPVGLARGVGTGVYDLFYEPANAVVNNPMDFTGAVVKGTSSFVSKSLQGGASSASKVTGSLGKALGALSLDDEYIKEREKTSRKKSSNVKEGLTEGISVLGRGVADGASGLFKQPIKGANKHGFKGLIKGIGKGIIGAPVKPVAGVVDMVHKTSEGFSNQGKEMKRRKRFPRAFRDDGGVVPYDMERSKVDTALRTNVLEEHALFHCPINKRHPQEVAILGHSAVYCVNTTTEKILWSVRYDQIVNVSLADDRQSVAISYSQGKSSSTVKRVENGADDDQLLARFYRKLMEFIAKETSCTLLE